MLTFYDPDRSQMVTHNGRVETWEHFQTLTLDLRESLRAKKGAGLRHPEPSGDFAHIGRPIATDEGAVPRGEVA